MKYGRNQCQVEIALFVCVVSFFLLFLFKGVGGGWGEVKAAPSQYTVHITHVLAFFVKRCALQLQMSKCLCLIKRRHKPLNSPNTLVFASGFRHVIMHATINV